MKQNELLYMRKNLKHLGLIGILSIFTIVLITSSIGYAAAVNVGSQDNPSNPVTKHKVCGDKLCSGKDGVNVGSQDVPSHHVTKYKICGDRLCSESAPKVEAKIVEEEILLIPPYIEEFEVIKGSTDSENMFKAIYKVYAGEQNISKIQILVKSDSDLVYMTSSGIWEGGYDLITIRIQASDKDSISTEILSWEIKE